MDLGEARWGSGRHNGLDLLPGLAAIRCMNQGGDVVARRDRPPNLFIYEIESAIPFDCFEL